MKNSLLLVLSELPVATTGGGVLLREISRHLFDNWDVHAVVPVLPHQQEEFNRVKADLSKIVATWTILKPILPWGRSGYSIRRLASGLPSSIYNFATPENEQHLANARKRLRPVTELAISTWAAAAYPGQLFTLQTHLYMVNVDHEIVSARSQNLLRRLDCILERRRARRQCVRAVNSAGKVAAISARDANTLKQLAGRGDIKVAPPLMQPRPVSREVVVPGSVMLPTNFTYAHNRVALEWFLTRVWPSVNSNAMLWVTGRDDDNAGLRALCRRHDRVDYLGCLPREKLDERFAMASVCVNPTRSGSGFQIKLLDAMARGVPVVTTAFSNAIGSELPSSDDPCQFASLVNAALQSPGAVFPYDQFYEKATRAWSEFLV